MTCLETLPREPAGISVAVSRLLRRPRQAARTAQKKKEDRGLPCISPGPGSFGFSPSYWSVLAFESSTSTRVDASGNWLLKLDSLLQNHHPLGGHSRVVIRVANAGALSPIVSLVQVLGGHVFRSLPIINGLAVDLPNLALPLVSLNPLVVRLSMDRVVAGAMGRTGATVGATAVRQELGVDGSGVGVAVIDSGVSPSHDDLADPARAASASIASSTW